jgi:hypothetical protein
MTTHRLVNRRLTLSPAPRVRRPAISSIEVLVGFIILSTALTLSLPLLVQHQRLLESARHYRLALDELSNQLDRLSLLPPSDVALEVARLTPSPFFAKQLPDAKLAGDLKAADIGQRITLRLTWTDIPRRPTTLALATWILPAADVPPTVNNGDRSP